MSNHPTGTGTRTITRVQTGVRIEANLLKVLKAVAELRDLSLGELIEGIALHALEGKTAFADSSLARIGMLREVYGLTLTAADAHSLSEAPQMAERPSARGTSEEPNGAQA